MFGYDQAVTDQYPAVRAGVIHAAGVSNGPSPAGLLADYRAEQQAARARLAGTPIADLPSIAAWRRAFSRFGAKPTQYRNAAEALLRRLAKQGDIPSLSTLVDIGNLVSIRYALPVAVFDRARVAGTLTVRLATGAEQFSDLGSSGSVSPEPGEVIFSDEDNVVAARRWCWRQSAQSATGAGTAEALIVTEAQHDTAEADITAAVADLTALLACYQPRAAVAAHTLLAQACSGDMSVGVARSVSAPLPWSGFAPREAVAMFGRVGQALHRNMVICLALVAAVLLVTGLAIAVTAPSAVARQGTAQHPVRPAAVRTHPAG
jgi:DNA/RNA-binding domain of Phe-tRNA-synthetase-like protein